MTVLERMAATSAVKRRLEDEAATGRLGAAIAAAMRPGDAILLHGRYGAGKTTLARALIRAAAGDPRLVVPSPSFTLAQPYSLPSGVTLTHYDLWRVGEADEIAELGWQEAREGIVVVEWPERLGEAQPDDALSVTLTAVPGEPLAREAVLEGWTGRLEGVA